MHKQCAVQHIIYRQISGNNKIYKILFFLTPKGRLQPIECPQHYRQRLIASMISEAPLIALQY